MKKVMLIGAFLVSSLAIQAQTVDDIVSKHTEAMGGADKLKALKSIKQEMAMQVMGTDLEATSTVVSGRGLRMDINAMGMTITQAIDGNSGWAINPMQGGSDPVVMPEDAMKEAATQLDLTGPLVNYKEKGNTIELQGTEKVGEGNAYKLKVKSKNGVEQTHFVDAQNYMIVKSVTTQGDVVYSNFQTVDGLKFPFASEITNPQVGKMLMTVKKVTVNPTVDESIFKMPSKK